jgi:hypothetical protein
MHVDLEAGQLLDQIEYHYQSEPLVITEQACCSSSELQSFVKRLLALRRVSTSLLEDYKATFGLS